MAEQFVVVIYVESYTVFKAANIFNPNYFSLQEYFPFFGHPNRPRVGLL